MPKGPNKLIVVAHPDDETLFFGGLLQREAKLGYQVICVTNGGADGRASERALEFGKACKLLGAKKFDLWSFPDVYERRIDTGALSEKLRNLPKFKEVYTHSIVGDYGHPHHQDVAVAVSKAFRGSKTQIFHVAYNAYPVKNLELKKSEFERKCKVLVEVYGQETQRFLNLLPCRSSESFCHVAPNEVDAIYAFLSGASPTLDLKPLKIYRKLAPFLKIFGSEPMKRPF